MIYSWWHCYTVAANFDNNLCNMAHIIISPEIKHNSVTEFIIAYEQKTKDHGE